MRRVEAWETLKWVDVESSPPSTLTSHPLTLTLLEEIPDWYNRLSVGDIEEGEGLSFTLHASSSSSSSSSLVLSNLELSDTKVYEP